MAANEGAKVRNVVKIGGMEAAAQDLGPTPDVKIPTTGQARRETDTVETAQANELQKEHLAALAFLEEIVTVRVEESADEKAENPVHVTVNGVNQFFFRGQEQDVKRKFLGVLATAKPAAYVQPNPYASDETRNILNTRRGLRYPFTVISDKNPLGAEWLKRLLQEV
jgi:hypothetical protein